MHSLTHTHTHTLHQVNNNGALTFTSQARMYEQVVFPNNPHQLIAPFWADADTRGSGTVWYFESTDQTLLAKARTYIQRGFVAEQDFQPTHLFVATWDEVGYYDRNTDKVGRDFFLSLIKNISWSACVWHTLLYCSY